MRGLLRSGTPCADGSDGHQPRTSQRPEALIRPLEGPGSRGPCLVMRRAEAALRLRVALRAEIRHSLLWPSLRCREDSDGPGGEVVVVVAGRLDDVAGGHRRTRSRRPDVADLYVGWGSASAGDGTPGAYVSVPRPLGSWRQHPGCSTPFRAGPRLDTVLAWRRSEPIPATTSATGDGCRYRTRTYRLAAGLAAGPLSSRTGVGLAVRRAPHPRRRSLASAVRGAQDTRRTRSTSSDMGSLAPSRSPA